MAGLVKLNSSKPFNTHPDLCIICIKQVINTYFYRTVFKCTTALNLGTYWIDSQVVVGYVRN